MRATLDPYLQSLVWVTGVPEVVLAEPKSKSVYLQLRAYNYHASPVLVQALGAGCSDEPSGWIEIKRFGYHDFDVTVSLDKKGPGMHPMLLRFVGMRDGKMAEYRSSYSIKIEDWKLP